MNPARLAALVGLAALTAACATGAGTKVTLLDGEPGQATGAVVVLDPKSEAERGLLDAANTQAAADARKVKAAAVDAARYADLTAALPRGPTFFRLYFTEGTTNLDPGSLDEFRRMREEVAQRPGAEVQVTGHTDTVGSSADNDRLSIERARQIRSVLISQGLDPAITRATGRGERELLVPTADNVEEPKNRRVEVTVR